MIKYKAYTNIGDVRKMKIVMHLHILEILCALHWQMV